MKPPQEYRDTPVPADVRDDWEKFKMWTRGVDSALNRGPEPTMGECQKCGTWVCRVCNGSRSRANRSYPDGQRCPRCKSSDGFFVPVRHQSDIHGEVKP